MIATRWGYALSSSEHHRFHRIDFGQMPGDAGPGRSLVSTGPDFALRRSQVEPQWLMCISGHRLPFDRPPGIRPREPLVLPHPTLARIARDIGGRLSVRAHAWPDGRAVHREYPGNVRIAGVHHHRKADIADLFGHILSYAHPFFARPVEPVDSTVILLVQAVGITRAEPDAMGIVEGHCGRVETLNDVEPFDERRERLPAIDGLVHPTAGHREIQMLRVARVHDDRMQFGAVRRAVLHGAHPLTVLRIVINVGEWLPGDSSVIRAEQTLRGGAGIPGVWLVRMARGQPERMVHCAALFAIRHFGKCGWSR